MHPLRTAQNIILVSLLVLFFLPIFLIVLIQLQPVQNFLTQKVQDYLNDQLNTYVELKKVSYAFPYDISITGLYIEDYNLDTLFYIQKLKVLPFSFSIKKQKIKLLDIELNGFKTKIIYDSTGKSNLDFFLQNLIHTSKKDTSKNLFFVNIKKIKIKNATIIYQNLYADTNKSQAKFNPNDLYIKNLNLDIENFNYTSDSLSFALKNLSFQDKSMLQIKHFAVNLFFGNNILKLNDLTLETKYSSLLADLNFLYKNKKDLSDFIHKVNFDINIYSAKIHSKDIALFNPNIRNINDSLSFNMELEGNVPNLRLNSFNLFYSDSTKMETYGEVIGLPDIENSYLDINIPILTTNASDILNLIALYNPKLSTKLSSQLVPYGNINISASITGLFKDFNLSAKINTANGSLFSNYNISHDSSQLNIEGIGGSENLNLAKILKNKKLGTLSFEDTIKLNIKKNSLNGITSARITNITFNNYTYNNILLNGKFTNKSFNGNFRIADSNFRANYTGLIDFENKTKKLNFSLTVDTIQLYKLHLIKDDPMAGVSFALNVNMQGKDINNMIGYVKLTKPLLMIKNLELFKINNFDITASIPKYIYNKPVKHISINTDFFNATLEGIYKFKDLAKYAHNFANYFIPILFNKPKPDPQKLFSSDDTSYFTMQLNLTKPNAITYFFAPHIKIANNSLITSSFFAKTKSFLFYIKSDSINLKKTHLTNFFSTMSADTQSLKVNIKCDSITTGKLKFKNFAFSSSTANNFITSRISWNNKTKNENNGKLNININFKRDSADNLCTYINAQNDTFKINGNTWILHKLSMNKDSSLKINTISISDDKANQKIILKGRISDNPKDTLHLKIQNFEIAQLQPLLNKIKILGKLNGKLKIVNAKNNPGIFAKLLISDLKINKVKLGFMAFNTNWIAQNNILKLSLSIYKLRNKNDTLKNIAAIGTINTKTKIYDIYLNINKLKIIIFQPFFEKILKVNRLANIQGEISIKGNPAYYHLNGDVKLFGSFKIIPTNIIYTINKNMHIHFDNEKITIDTTVITDSKMLGDGFIAAKIKHKNFKDFNMDVLISLDTMPILDIKQNPKTDYFGKIFTSGRAELTGDLDNINLKANITTEPGTDLSILLNRPTQLSKNQSFITFVKDTTQTQKQITIKKSASVSKINYNLSLNLRIKNQAKFHVIFDQTTGEALDIAGDGEINLNKTNYSDLSMFGLITLKKGTYTLVLQNLIRKKFFIKPGSTIKWNGQPTDALMNITTVYKLNNVNLYDLVLDDNYWNEKTPVECYIKMNGSITEPKISFDIALPKADPRILSQVKHLDQANKNLQFLSLLVLGKFQPLPGLVFDPQRQNINATSVLSNQISGWLSQIMPNMDMDINYQAQKNAKNQFDVAMSVNLLNERLTINTDIGIAGNQNNAQTNYNNFIGDVEIEAKLNKKGNIRLKAFNKTNRYEFYEKGPYTQGIGLFFKHDFNSLFKANKN